MPGDARGNAARAVDAANQYDFDKAEEYLKEANRELKEAHKVQTEQIQAEAGGAVCTVNLMMVHAQDHFTMALMAIDQAKEAIYLNRKLDAMSIRKGNKMRILLACAMGMSYIALS
jgi:cellobiose-specific phosphotransferase system component IIA